MCQSIRRVSCHKPYWVEESPLFWYVVPEASCYIILSIPKLVVLYVCWVHSSSHLLFILCKNLYFGGHASLLLHPLESLALIPQFFLFLSINPFYQNKFGLSLWAATHLVCAYLSSSSFLVSIPSVQADPRLTSPWMLVFQYLPVL